MTNKKIVYIVNFILKLVFFVMARETPCNLKHGSFNYTINFK